MLSGLLWKKDKRISLLHRSLCLSYRTILETNLASNFSDAGSRLAWVQTTLLESNKQIRCEHAWKHQVWRHYLKLQIAAVESIATNGNWSDRCVCSDLTDVNPSDVYVEGAHWDPMPWRIVSLRPMLFHPAQKQELHLLTKQCLLFSYDWAENPACHPGELSSPGLNDSVCCHGKAAFTREESNSPAESSSNL